MPHQLDRTLTQFLLTMAIVIVAGFFNWLKRRSQPKEPTDAGSERKPSPPTRPARPSAPGVPMPAPPRPPVRRLSWEEELRRLLEGPDTAPVPSPPKPESKVDRPAPAYPQTTPPPPLPILRPAPVRPILVEQDLGLPVQLPGLTASTQSHERASQLDRTVAEHLQEVSQRVRLHAARPLAAAASREVAQALALVRDQQSLRSAIMASVILGPPKALEV